MTLLQLNRHLDDVHQELPEETQDEVKTWFDKQVRKAKRFQPLSIINQKLRGLDVFETNESQVLPVISNVAPGTGSRTPDAVIDPEELVTRKHWQKSSGHDVCTDPLCDRRLGPLNGNVNCRKCGRLFCEEHTMYQMKLARNANTIPYVEYGVESVRPVISLGKGIMSTTACCGITPMSSGQSDKPKWKGRIWRLRD